jgi:uncharacterized membrane protein YdjX (TVP38/TMEM64 family)
MDDTDNKDKQQEAGQENWLKKRLVPILTIVLVIAISAGLFIFNHLYPEKVSDFENYGYLGAFLVGLVANATIILPMPGLVILVAIGTILNPVLVGLVGTVGGVIGEIIGYVAGYSGRGLLGKEKMYTRAENWMRKRGFITVFIFALVPLLPIDIAGLLAGALRYPMWKFFLACFLGKGMLYILVVQTSVWGWDFFSRILGW